MLQVVQVRSNSSHDAKYRKKEIGRIEVYYGGRRL